MVSIKEYWTDKEKRAIRAKLHTNEMQDRFFKEINKSIFNTDWYSPIFRCNTETENKNTEIIIDNIDSVSAIFKYAEPSNKTAVLNFASYKNPGGRFIDGSKAQEECLCHESFLYNVLSGQKGFYAWNNTHSNKALYLNRGLYSPNIYFIRDIDGKEIIKNCDVITCACPNKTAAQRYMDVSGAENSETLRSRIKFVLDIAKSQKVNTLILGAYGCGVFGQDPYEVASLFKHYLETSHNSFDRVVFAVPEGKDGNLEAFRYIFTEDN